MKTKTILIQQQEFVLHGSGAIYWKDRDILLISDVHLGKVAHFRKHGIAIPQQAIFENFNRLSETVEFFKPNQIVFLGDLFHSKINKEWDFFAAWASSVSSSILLIKGNHDVIDSGCYEDLGIDCHQSWTVEDFYLTHHPEEKPGYFNFCGHVHPGIRLQDIGRQALSLPCFFHQPAQMILPAFGEFTGNFYLKPAENDKVYAITGSEVIQVFGN